MLFAWRIGARFRSAVALATTLALVALAVVAVQESAGAQGPGSCPADRVLFLNAGGYGSVDLTIADQVVAADVAPDQIVELPRLTGPATIVQSGSDEVVLNAFLEPPPNVTFVLFAPVDRPVLAAYGNDVSPTVDTGGRLVLRHAAAVGALDIEFDGSPLDSLTPTNEVNGTLSAGSYQIEVLLDGAEVFDFTLIIEPGSVHTVTLTGDASGVRGVTEVVQVGTETLGCNPVEVPTCNGMDATVVLANGDAPTPGDDIIVGTDGADVIAAGDGDDVICGGDGDDQIWGQGGNDQIYGDAGDDRIRGGDGNDTVRGGLGADDLNGGRGDDLVQGEAGDDAAVRGGTGNDTVDGGDGDDALVAGNGGEDQVTGGAGNDKVTGGPRPDTVRGGAGDDLVKGNKGADVVDGGSGNDELRGGPQADLLFGGDGVDECNGGNTGGEPPAVEADEASACETLTLIEKDNDASGID